VLFIDARKLGRMVDRTHRELIDEEIARITRAYHAWRSTSLPPLPPGEGWGEGGGYADIPGFCKSATLEDIRKHGHVLTPGRYVGAEAQEDDGEPFEEKMQRLTAQLREQQAEARRLDEAICKNLKELGYDA
jgi:type I restriction enzyme M protein